MSKTPALMLIREHLLEMYGWGRIIIEQRKEPSDMTIPKIAFSC